MALLQPQDYNETYFAGTIDYGYPLKRWHRIDNNVVPYEECTGELYKDRAKKIFDRFNLRGKKVLDLGCAFGYLITDLRELGAEAYGIDFSQYAYDNAEPEAKPYITLADIRTHLSNYLVNEFELVVCSEILHCLTNPEIKAVLNECNRIGKHIFVCEREAISGNPEAMKYYNGKTLADWKALLSKKAVLVSRETRKEFE